MGTQRAEAATGCRSVGEKCRNDSQCCTTHCKKSTGKCACINSGSCQANRECCTKVCKRGRCVCKKVGETCTLNGECCGTLASSACQNGKCCKKVGATCKDNNQCCGDATCQNGECACGPFLTPCGDTCCDPTFETCCNGKCCGACQTCDPGTGQCVNMCTDGEKCCLTPFATHGGFCCPQDQECCIGSSIAFGCCEPGHCDQGICCSAPC